MKTWPSEPCAGYWISRRRRWGRVGKTATRGKAAQALGSTTRLQRARERGQAAVELVMVLPLLVLMILGLLLLGRMLYIHLALLTATNDCATAAAQAVRSDQAYRQGNAARSQSLATFAVPQDNPGGLGFSNDATCQTGYTAAPEMFFWGGGTWHPRIFTIYYQFSQPLQPYKSDWRLAD